jgi:hypothetical protein
LAGEHPNIGPPCYISGFLKKERGRLAEAVEEFSRARVLGYDPLVIRKTLGLSPQDFQARFPLEQARGRRHTVDGEHRLSLITVFQETFVPEYQRAFSRDPNDIAWGVQKYDPGFGLFGERSIQNRKGQAQLWEAFPEPPGLPPLKQEPYTLAWAGFISLRMTERKPGHASTNIVPRAETKLRSRELGNNSALDQKETEGRAWNGGKSPGRLFHRCPKTGHQDIHRASVVPTH